MGIAGFIEYIQAERRYSEHTVRAYEQDLQEFCSYLNCEPTDWDPQKTTTYDVRMWLVEMLDKGASPRTVKRKMSSLRSFYKYMLRIGKVENDITRSVITPKADKPLPVFFKEQEMERAEAQMSWADDFSSLRDSLIVEMLYETGMRRAELVGLRDADIDLRQQQVRVFGKRRKERIVPFGDRLTEMIRAYMELREQEFGGDADCEGTGVRNNTGGAGQASEYFLLSDKGRPLTAAQLYNIVRTRMGEVSSLKKHSPHVLRHTFATTMLNNGADINTIKDLLGHASLAATQVYTHTTFEQLREAYRKAHPRAK